MPDKVTATAAALQLLAEIVADHGPVLFHQSGGCCDGSSPMCYPQSEFLIGDNDVKLGEIGGAPFYISRSQYEVWKHTDLIIDVVPGRGDVFTRQRTRASVPNPIRDLRVPASRRGMRQSKLTVTLSPRPCRGSGWETKLLWQIKRIGLRPTNFLMKQFFCGDQMLAKRVNWFFKPISAL